VNCPSASLYLLGTLAAGLFSSLRVEAVSLDELRSDPKLTPRRFAGYFSDFKDCFHEEVQLPEVFLAAKSGDCDDYAILADLVLKPKGYDTRLISVRMPGMVAHVVCYVTQEKGYLDYNNRVYYFKIEHAGPTIRQIATKVSKSFSANWTSASEFTYSGGLKRLVATVVKTDPPERDPAPVKSRQEIKIDF
jgi:hypothetical protein